MYKPKSIGSLTSGQVWDAHVAKAASSHIHAREYKKSNYVLDTDKVTPFKLFNTILYILTKIIRRNIIMF